MRKVNKANVVLDPYEAEWIRDLLADGDQTAGEVALLFGISTHALTRAASGAAVKYGTAYVIRDRIRIWDAEIQRRDLAAEKKAAEATECRVRGCPGPPPIPPSLALNQPDS